MLSTRNAKEREYFPLPGFQSDLDYGGSSSACTTSLLALFFFFFFFFFFSAFVQEETWIQLRLEQIIFALACLMVLPPIRGQTTSCSATVPCKVGCCGNGGVANNA